MNITFLSNQYPEKEIKKPKHKTNWLQYSIQMQDSAESIHFESVSFILKQKLELV